MNVRYHFMEPGEDIALVRMAREGTARDRTIHIVVTVREKDFRELVREADVKVALLDYDGTFTRIGKVWQPLPGREETYQTGWQELRRRLPVEGHRALDRHYALYKRGDITPLEWLYISIACYQEYGLTLEDIRATAGAVPFRDGHEEFITLLRRHFEKRCILSFGLAEWIECRREFESFTHETVASSVLCDAAGRIVGVRAGVTEETKGVAAAEILRTNGWEKQNAFAVGNSWHDRNLFSSAGISAYLSHGGYKGSNIDHAAEVERLKSIATAIVFDDTLFGVNDFLRKVIGKSF